MKTADGGWLIRQSGRLLVLAMMVVVAACGGQAPAPAKPTVVAAAPTAAAPASATLTPTVTASLAVTASHTATSTATATATPTATATATPTASPTVTPTTSPTATPTATPDPYAGLTIEDLTRRSYGKGELVATQTLGATSAFTRELISFPSDGLEIVGFLNKPRIPAGERRPVVIVLHGYVEPSRYRTLTYTTGYADALARAGFVAIHPNLRNFPPSDEGDDRFRVGQAIDVLNLIALVKQQAGQPGPLEQADPERIGLWGHSMGGGIATRVMTVSPDVDAVVLYGAMSGDERQNYEKIRGWSGGQRGQWELAVAEEDLERISPINFLDQVEAAVSIHHGTADDTVPIAWSRDMCERLEALGKEVACYEYAGQPHTFVGEGDALFVGRVREFFEEELGR